MGVSPFHAFLNGLAAVVPGKVESIFATGTIFVSGA